MFAKQGNIAMDTSHCPITSLTHSGTFSQKLPHMIPIEHISMSFALSMDGKPKEKAA